MRQDAYQEITDRIIKLLEEGTVPWQKPWVTRERHPRNLVSGKKYRGINAFILSNADYTSPYWLTYKQASDRGGHVRRGEKGFPCVYWNWTEIPDEKTGEMELIPFLRKYTVFNVQQCENVPYLEIKANDKECPPIEICEKIISGMPNPPSIEHGMAISAYYPSMDCVQMPFKNHFHNQESYYSSLFHELIHSTGHESRLARPEVTNKTKFGSEKYGREELAAEMGATYLCGHAGIENIVLDNSASYIDGWLGKLNDDRRLVVTAASQAQKAADYILRDSLNQYDQTATSEYNSSINT